MQAGTIEKVKVQGVNLQLPYLVPRVSENKLRNLGRSLIREFILKETRSKVVEGQIALRSI